MELKEKLKSVFGKAKKEDISICDSCLCYLSPGFRETIYNQWIMETDIQPNIFTCLCEKCDKKQPSIFDMFDENGDFIKH